MDMEKIIDNIIIDVTNENATTVKADIRVTEHPEANKFKKLYYVAFVVIFILGFFVGSGTNYSDGGQVMNRYSENNGEYFPAHEDKYTGWYFLRFTFEGEGWQHNYFYDMGYSNDKTYWGEQKESYPENVFIFIVLNILLAAAPFVFEFTRKKECQNTQLNIKDDKIYGSCGIAIIKKKIDIPFANINNITVSQTKADKLRSGKTLQIIHGDKKSVFHYIHNAEEVKNYINNCVDMFKSKKEESQQTTVIKSDSSADELKKYKELLDNGVITQEEFDAKKKQLLGI